MSSKLTELTKSSPSAPPPSVLCRSGILSRLASSGHFDPGQKYDVYKEVEVLDPACTECLAKGNDFFQNIQSAIPAFLGRSHVIVLGQRLPMSEGICGGRKMGLMGKSSQFLRDLLLMVLQDIPVGDVARWTNVGGPIYSSSEVPISRINAEGVVKRIRKISNSPPNLDAKGSEELDGEEVEVVNNPVGHQSSTSPSQPPAKLFQSCLIPSTPKNFQPTLATIPTSLPPASPSSSHTRPAMIPAVRPSPIQQSRTSPIVTSQKLQ
ncbi:hypothetical protein O181_007355 [Austropuccinia psidii MF-1]|uniref:Uncharacterized protein n=1 Tax=Austropuccinia psidii MF-1 TaxID=1389203 RepID=A0A9Q3BMS3_9BASI|nr:hypothetical protein [Austropuccinia psidii MF-1]